MAKEYTWTINGKEISCQESGNKFFIYEGDDFVATVYKKTFGITDEEVTVCGVPCRFVVINEKPDIAVDGIFLGSRKSYSEQAKEQRRRARLFAVAEIIFGLIAFAASIILSVTKTTVIYTPFLGAVAAVSCIYGIFELISSRKK